MDKELRENIPNVIQISISMDAEGYKTIAALCSNGNIYTNYENKGWRLINKGNNHEG